MNLSKNNFIAHRGLHKGREIPENSLKAFKEAILNHCQKFSFQDNLWIDLPKLNIKRCTAYAIEWINHIYVFGGYTGIFQRS